MRRYAAALPDVTFVNDAGVRGLITRSATAARSSSKA